MMKNSQDTSEQDFQRHNKVAGKYYQQPSPKYSPKPNEFDKLVYVATVFNQAARSSFKHSDTSPFQSVTPSKR